MCLILACANEGKKTLAVFSKHAFRILKIVSFILKATSASQRKLKFHLYKSPVNSASSLWWSVKTTLPVLDIHLNKKASNLV